MSKFALSLVIAVVLFAGCKKEEDPPVTPPAPVVHDEVFTTMRLTFTNTEPVTIGGGYDSYIYTYRELDGQAPVIEGEPLPVGAYSVSIRLWNENVSPAVELTSQVRANAVTRQFFFEPQALALVIYDRELDANGMPFGMNFYVNAMMTGSGSLKVTMQHDLDKNADGVAQGDITNAGGETEMEVVFPMEVI